MKARGLETRRKRERRAARSARRRRRRGSASRRRPGRAPSPRRNETAAVGPMSSRAAPFCAPPQAPAPALTSASPSRATRALDAPLPVDERGGEPSADIAALDIGFGAQRRAAGSTGGSSVTAIAAGRSSVPVAVSRDPRLERDPQRHARQRARPRGRRPGPSRAGRPAPSSRAHRPAGACALDGARR